MKGIYLDNAATSWPKPKSVIKNMKLYFNKIGGSAGRSGHWRAIEAGRIVLAAREALGEVLNVQDESHLIFTKNGSEALNLAILGSVKPGDHVVATSMEHNSVLRPLACLIGKGIDISYVKGNRDGMIDPLDIEMAITEKTKLVAVTHASNVTGTINDIAAINQVCQRKKVLMLVDAAQSAGCIPLDLKTLGADFVAMAGHKGLLGPQGTGALYVREKELIEPLILGGTGSLSDSEEMPDFLPDRFESGTANTIGLAGLEAGCRYLLKKGISRIQNHEQGLHELFMSELRKNEKIKIYGPSTAKDKTAVLSLNIDGMSSSEAGRKLDENYGICTRIGLHCAPRAHKTIGSFPNGTIRFSWGPFTTEKEILKAAKTVLRIADND